MPVLDTDTAASVRFSSSKNDNAPAAQPQASHRGEADRLRHEAAMGAKIKAKELAKNEKAAAVARARRLGTFKRVAGTVAGLALLEGFTPPSDDEIRKEVAMRKAGLDALRAFCGYLGLNDAMKVNWNPSFLATGKIFAGRKAAKWILFPCKNQAHHHFFFFMGSRLSCLL